MLVVYQHNHDAKLAADGDGAVKEGFHLFGCGIRGDVVILWRAAQQMVAHTAADPEGGVAGLLQADDDVPGDGWG